MPPPHYRLVAILFACALRSSFSIDVKDQIASVLQKNIERKTFSINFADHDAKLTAAAEKLGLAPGEIQHLLEVSKPQVFEKVRESFEATVAGNFELIAESQTPIKIQKLKDFEWAGDVQKFYAQFADEDLTGVTVVSSESDNLNNANLVFPFAPRFPDLPLTYPVSDNGVPKGTIEVEVHLPLIGADDVVREINQTIASADYFLVLNLRRVKERRDFQATAVHELQHYLDFLRRPSQILEAINGKVQPVDANLSLTMILEHRALDVRRDAYLRSEFTRKFIERESETRIRRGAKEPRDQIEADIRKTLEVKYLMALTAGLNRAYGDPEKPAYLKEICFLKEYYHLSADEIAELFHKQGVLFVVLSPAEASNASLLPIHPTMRIYVRTLYDECKKLAR